MPLALLFKDISILSEGNPATERLGYHWAMWDNDRWLVPGWDRNYRLASPSLRFLLPGGSRRGEG